MGIIMSVIRAIDKVIRNSDSKAEIFKLKMDHFEEIFDWLSLKDLVALGKTCNRMNSIVGYYIKTHYTAVEFHSKSDGIFKYYKRFYLDEYNIPSTTLDYIKMDSFSSYLKKLRLSYLEKQEFDSEKHEFEKPTKIIPHMKVDRFRSLTEIQLSHLVLNDKGISRIKEILGQLETVKLNYVCFRYEKSEFYDKFLQFCTNVKKLCIHSARTRRRWRDKSFVGTDNSWLLRKYPTLEYFELISLGYSSDEPYEVGPIDELQTFFEQNMNVKTFATDIEIILGNIDTFKCTKAKWDVLCVRFHRVEKLNSLSWNCLNELNEHGLFKQLHLYFCDFEFNQTHVNQVISSNYFTKLYIAMMKCSTDLSSLINVKQLCIEQRCVDMEAVAKKLIKLEFLQLKYGCFLHAQPFIRYSPKLNTIVVLDDSYYTVSEAILKIEELNIERSKLINARKLTIYVEESFYLCVKWAKNTTQWSFIEIKRFDSYDLLYHSFDWNYWPSV